MPALDPVRARDVALEAGRAAAALLQSAWGHVTTVEHKSSPEDLVTEWDGRVEQLVMEHLAARAPGVPLLGEEGGERGGAADVGRWLVDPIDGTTNFAHGFPIFSVSIAYEIDGRIDAGVVIAPVLGWEFVAARGAGATLGGAPLCVSRCASLAEAILATGFPTDRKVSPRNNFREFEHFQRVAGAVRRCGAASLDLAFVAAGWFDGYWEYKLSAWDLAAGALLIEEAGGRVTSLTGGPFVAASGEAVASNGLIHDRILEELRRVP